MREQSRKTFLGINRLVYRKNSQSSLYDRILKIKNLQSKYNIL